MGPRTPRQRWTFSDCLGEPQLAPVIADSLAAVPTPADLLVSKGTDGSVAIYQPATDTYWNFWRAERDASGHWSACRGGKIEHYSRNPGVFSNPLGATATGLPFGAFAIRIDEDPRPYLAAHDGIDPYIALMDPDNLVPDGAERYVVLSEIPVDRLQALPLDYGRPGR